MQPLHIKKSRNIFTQKITQPLHTKTHAISQEKNKFGNKNFATKML